MAHEKMMTEDLQRCIDACLECHRVCMETVNHCLMMGGKHAEAMHIRTMLDCAQICSTSADFMLRGSEYHSRVCLVCAELCFACADSCHQVDPHDSKMSECVEICRECANLCRSMAGRAA